MSRCLALKDENAPPGICAVIVYPMNALAEDQLGRLRSLLAGTGIPFGLYVGKLFGRSLIVEIGQNPIDMEVPGAMLGAIVGCTLARVFTRRKKAGKE